MSTGLDIDPPSRKQTSKFEQAAEGQKVQFNKRVTQSTADGYEILAIRTKIKVPALLAEGLALLEQKYGNV